MSEQFAEESQSPQNLQTRFSFYTAPKYSVEVVTDVYNGASNDSETQLEEGKEFVTQTTSGFPQEQPQRFNFYAAPPPHGLSPAAAGVPHLDVASQSVNFLRSAQANTITQRFESRRSPSRDLAETNNNNPPQTPNPYEDAIREALELLRKHRTTVSPSIDYQQQQADHHSSSFSQRDETWRDPQISSRRALSATNASIPLMHGSSPTSSDYSSASRLGEAYQAEIETRRQQRQQRMAKYAHRLAELKQQDVSVSQVDDDEDEDISTAAADRDDEDDGSSVQAGVERVLLAILERAGSRGRQTQPSSKPQYESSQNRGSMQSHSSWARGEEKKSVEEDNSLLQVMSDLLGTTSSLLSQQILPDDFDPVTASRSLDSVEVQPQYHPSTTSAASSPLLARTSITHLDTSMEAVEAIVHIEQQHSPPVSRLRQDQELSIDIPNNSASSDEHDELDELVRQFSSTTSSSTLQRHVNNDPIEERVRQILSSDSSLDQQTAVAATDFERVPDQLMKTCVEVEQSRFGPSSGRKRTDDHSRKPARARHEASDIYGSLNDRSRDTSVDRVLGPLAKSSATTGVVLEADSPEQSSGMFVETLSAVMSLVIGDTPLSPTVTEASRDRYTDADDTSDASSSDDDESTSSEANDLMRSLCAHLLPVGVDQTSRVLDALPEWDESNADEPGYRIVRLRNGQLRRVEEEFQSMVEKLKRHSQRDLSKLGGSDGSDAVFERDLQAAEALLDREELRILDAKPSDEGDVSHVSTNGHKRNSRSGGVEHDTGSDHETLLAAFPGIKSAGKGEMGDLEYFHLPVIFKSHVTGFEPTKDMYLEAGNVIAGQYLVQGELGSAAFSTAYKCTDLSSEGDGPDGHEEVCLKVIKNTKDFFDQSLDEIKILELLRQTGMCHEKAIVEMKTFFYYREHLIIVTELLRQNLFEFGKFIADNNQEPYFTLPRLAYITRQCLIALEFVHSLNLVHSDVKPENILLGSYRLPTVKLIDFGSSCYLTDRQSSYIQSRSYRAPEVVLGLPYDGRIDIWSLGCVVAEMYTGEVTFQNDSIVSMLSRIEAICGPFPRHMIAQGRQSGRFFTKCGLLFERVAATSADAASETDESRRREVYDIFQPKTTTLAARLGFVPDLMEEYDSGKILSTEDRYQQALFVDFVRQTLTIEPESRCTATAALRHPWMLYASTLKEDDVQYPSG